VGSLYYRKIKFVKARHNKQEHEWKVKCSVSDKNRKQSKRDADSGEENRKGYADYNFRQNHRQKGNCLNVTAHFELVPVYSDSADSAYYGG